VGNPKLGGLAAKVVAIGVIACLIAVAWTAVTETDARPTATSSPIVGPGAQSSPTSNCLVGEAWDAYAEERIAMWDQPAIEKPIDAAGGTYEFVDAKASYEEQATQIDAFVAEGAKVILVRAVDTVEIIPAVERAAAAGVPVIVYDRLVDSPKALLVAFDPVEIGRMEARAILAARPKGNYVIIKGHPQGQLEPDLIASGIREVLQPAIDKGDIKVVAETYTMNWDPATAQTEMETILSENHNKIDAVISEDDNMAGGVVAALKEVGLDGKVAVAGQGGDMWGLNRVALGTQTVDVWPDLRLLGKAAGDAAVALCKNPAISKVKGASPLSLPEHQATALLVTPQPITKDNLNVVIDSAWIKKPDVCASIAPSKAPPACR
jgi:D-xylose transport system substrate-binding protein